MIHKPPHSDWTFIVYYSFVTARIHNLV